MIERTLSIIKPDAVAAGKAGAILKLLEDNAIAKLREVMGATDPAKAADGTVRKLFATSIERNCIHGSDAVETARFETGYFFNALESA